MSKPREDNSAPAKITHVEEPQMKKRKAKRVRSGGYLAENAAVRRLQGVPRGGEDSGPLDTSRWALLSVDLEVRDRLLRSVDLEVGTS